MSSREIVESFLNALEDLDLARAGELMADDIRYVNVGLPAIVGRRRVVRALGAAVRPGAAFEAHLHAISADGSTVLTERTDVIVYRRFRAQFWVTGRFDVHAEKITLWRDSFDYVDVLRSIARGLAGVLVPALRPAAPAGPDAVPGRPSILR